MQARVRDGKGAGKKPQAASKAPGRTSAGILPVQAIRGLIEAGQVKLAAAACCANQMQPASLDLRLGGQAFRVRASFLPGAEHRLPPSCATCTCTPST